METPRQSADEVSKTDRRLANLTGGSRKGVPNKTTAAIKDMVIKALDKAGGVDYLVEQADKNPAAFLTLVGKVIPLQVTGENGGPIAVTRIELVGIPPE